MAAPKIARVNQAIIDCVNSGQLPTEADFAAWDREAAAYKRKHHSLGEQHAFRELERAHLQLRAEVRKQRQEQVVH